jgi:5'-nucleotidase
MNRRSFINRSSKYLGAYAITPVFPLLGRKEELVKLTILHTNDVHSRIDPFPMDGGRNQGKGGAERRAKLISQIRQNEENVLLLDAGDIFQGTPYFNFFKGELEFKTMSAMRYDASTIGNHDFDLGIEGLYKQLPHASFSFISCNYDFTNTLMNGHVQPYKIFEKGGLKIGVTGVGIELNGLVPKDLYKETRYLDPLSNVNKVAKMLKKEEKCDYVICLSHLGYAYREDDRISDIHLAQNSYDIDLIIGGHTHTFLNKPDIRNNLKGERVIVNQVGFAGLMLGRIDVTFEKNSRRNCVTCENSYIG